MMTEMAMVRWVERREESGAPNAFTVAAATELLGRDDRRTQIFSFYGRREGSSSQGFVAEESSDAVSLPVEGRRGG